MFTIRVVSLSPELIGVGKLNFHQKSRTKRTEDAKSIPVWLFPCFFEGLGRIEGLLRSLFQFSFVGEIVVSITPEGCTVTGNTETVVVDLENHVIPIANQIEARGTEIANMVKGVPYQVTWVYTQTTEISKREL